MKLIPHTLVVRFEFDTGRVQVCCPCRPVHASDRIGAPLHDGFEDWGVDEVTAVYSQHLRQTEMVVRGPVNDRRVSRRKFAARLT